MMNQNDLIFLIESLFEETLGFVPESEEELRDNTTPLDRHNILVELMSSVGMFRD